MNYKEWLNEWLSTCVKPMVKSRTFEKYDEIVRLKIEPSLGDCDLAELSPSMLQRFTAELTEKYASNTVSGIIAVVRSSLTRAQKTGVIEQEFSNCIQRPKSREKKVESFTAAEQKKIESYIINNRKIKLYGIVLCLYTGLRLGELLALEWADIDFLKSTITVTKNSRDAWENGEYVKIIDTPKTATSRREIPLPRQLVPYLRILKHQNRRGFVISGKDGKPVSLRSYQKALQSTLKILNIPHRGFHALRHTFATRALECGMDVKTLSEILGHKNSSITLNRYAHSFEEHKTAMMNRVGRLLK